MNEKLFTLRLPQDLLDQADQLVPVIGAAGDFQAMRVTLSTVVRLALFRGLAALQEEFGDGGGDGAAKAKKKRSTMRAR